MLGTDPDKHLQSNLQTLHYSDGENKQLQSQIKDMQKLRYGYATLDWQTEKGPEEVTLKLNLKINENVWERKHLV